MKIKDELAYMYGYFWLIFFKIAHNFVKGPFLRYR